MADSPFDSARLLLDGAREDIEKFESLEAVYANDPETAGLVREMDPKTGDKLVKLKVLKQPPRDLRRLSHHIVSDLRHALDQATFAASEIILGSEPDSVYFPFAMNPKDLAHRLKKIPPELHAFLAAQEPYPRGNGYPGGNNLLRLLGTLAGPNKHEVALNVGIHTTAVEMTDVRGELFAAPWPRFDRTKNELVLFRIFPGGRVDYELFVPLHIAFRQSKGGDDVPIHALFRAWLEKVEAIIDGLESEAAKNAASV